MKPKNVLASSFFAGPTLEVARQLLGKTFWVANPGSKAEPWMVARIVETEGYCRGDPASHSAAGVTKRSAVMFGEPGRIYMYTMHRQRLVNFVTEPEGEPGAVLIRAVEPLIGLKAMERRRPHHTLVNLTNGPGKLAQALGLQMSDYGARLNGPRFFVCDDNYEPPKTVATTRIGISKGQELPWRFFIDGNSFVSKRSKTLSS